MAGIGQRPRPAGRALPQVGDVAVEVLAAARSPIGSGQSGSPTASPAAARLRHQRGVGAEEPGAVRGPAPSPPRPSAWRGPSWRAGGSACARGAAHRPAPAGPRRRCPPPPPCGRDSGAQHVAGAVGWRRRSCSRRSAAARPPARGSGAAPAPASPRRRPPRPAMSARIASIPCAALDGDAAGVEADAPCRRRRPAAPRSCRASAARPAAADARCRAPTASSAAEAQPRQPLAAQHVHRDAVLGQRLQPRGEGLRWSGGWRARPTRSRASRQPRTPAATRAPGALRGAPGRPPAGRARARPAARRRVRCRSKRQARRQAPAASAAAASAGRPRASITRRVASPGRGGRGAAGGFPVERAVRAGPRRPAPRPRPAAGPAPPARPRP